MRREFTHVGSGWISGTLAVSFGALGLGGVLCLLFPNWLTTPEFRSVYPLPLIRLLIQALIISSFVFGAISLALRRSKVLGLVGLLLVTVALLLGGSEVPLNGPVESKVAIGFDWFLLNLLVFGLLFIPLEKMAPLRRKQGTFHKEWKTDLSYFFLGHVCIQAVAFLTLFPSQRFVRPWLHPGLVEWVSQQPVWMQFIEIALVADFMQYWTHRAFHYFPRLWKFHAIHHAPEALDWLAASRLHLVDIVVTRAISFVPLFFLGFSEKPLAFYLVFVAVYSVYLHANLRFSFGFLERFSVSPRFHYWHHSTASEAADKNFAIHFPWSDRLFGTHYLPRHLWPGAMGIRGTQPPKSFLRQLIWPFWS